MALLEFYRDGGFPMYLITAAGVPLIAVAVLYFLRGDPKLRPLIGSLAGLTAATGVLGFGMGLVLTTRYLKHVPEPDRLITAGLGLAESLSDVILPAFLIGVAMLITSIGAFRAARRA